MDTVSWYRPRVRLVHAGAMLLRGFRLFGVALHREPKGTKRPFQEKFAKLFLTIAAELWLRGCPEAIDSTFQFVARSVTIRVAEKLAVFLFAHEACCCLGHAGN